MSAPKVAPTTEPYPPVSSVPPITAAMIASNSFCRPRSAAAEPTSQIWSMAKIQAQNAVNMKRETFTRRTGTPTFFAALASPPTAKIQLPNRVWVSR